MKNLITPFLVLFALNLNARSLEWQKFELEETISNKYETAILGVLKRTEFLVNSEVKYNDPGMPNFEDLSTNNFKVSDLAFDESKEDYIAFSKVGLELPVVGKAFQENQRKLKELYRYNESFDLFKNLQSIGVKVSVSENVDESKLEVVKNIVKNMDFSVAGFKPKVEVTQAKIQVMAKKNLDLKKGAEGIKLQEILEFLGQFGNAIGLVLAVVILGFLAFKLLKTYMEFVEKLKSMEENQAAPEQVEEDQSSDFGQNPMAPMAEQGAEAAGPSLDRFEKLLKLNAKHAGLIVKKWLRNDDDESKLILTAIAQQMGPEDIRVLFETLDDQDREKWNRVIGDYLDQGKIAKANSIISQTVMREVVGGSHFNDYELVDIILGMNKSTIKSYILSGTEFGKALPNLLSTDVFSEILDELTVEEVDTVISGSMNLNLADLASKLDEFKKDLLQYSDQTSFNPFSLKLIQALGEVKADKEVALYKHVINSCKKEDVVEIAKKQFPGALVFDLPVSLLKMVMQNYPMNKKINLLASLEEEKKTLLMESFLEEGSNAKEMIVMELETISNDEVALKRIQNSREEFMAEFISFARKSIESDRDHTEEIESLIVNWIDSMTEQKLKVAA